MPTLKIVSTGCSLNRKKVKSELIKMETDDFTVYLQQLSSIFCDRSAAVLYYVNVGRGNLL